MSSWLLKNDEMKAIEGLEQLAMVSMTASVHPDYSRSHLHAKHLLQHNSSCPQQVVAVEQELMEAELLNPVEEQEIGEEQYQFDGDDGIVETVRHELAVEQGEIVKVESDEEVEDEPESQGISDAITLCEKMEKLSIKFRTPETSLDLLQHLWQFRIELHRLKAQNSTQVTLHGWLGLWAESK
ncbi:hypothetical protein APHAL10511_004200 [Amanita phalloides]|nr:hypothetical protein APHAL10511_004200 [Amanita phalloides]